MKKKHLSSLCEALDYNTLLSGLYLRTLIPSSQEKCQISMSNTSQLFCLMIGNGIRNKNIRPLTDFVKRSTSLISLDISS